MTTRTTTASATPTTTDVGPATVLRWTHEALLGLTVRDLLRRLAAAEDALRVLRQRDGRTPEGEQAQLEHYARRLCEELRRRRR